MPKGPGKPIKHTVYRQKGSTNTVHREDRGIVAVLGGAAKSRVQQNSPAVVKKAYSTKAVPNSPLMSNTYKPVRIHEQSGRKTVRKKK